MKIQQGKYYRTAEGRKVGPAEQRNEENSYPWHIPLDGSPLYYREDGTLCTDNEDWRIVGEWGDTPTLWRDMTPEQKGALLLAEHEGKVVQSYGGESWFDVAWPAWDDDTAYRIRPEPKREVVEIDVFCAAGFGAEACAGTEWPATHRITFTTIDGKPDCASIRMEEV